MKRRGDIVPLFQNHEAKAKKNATSYFDPVVDEPCLTQEKFKTLGELPIKLVETNKLVLCFYELVCSFLKLVLILLVITASAERVFFFCIEPSKNQVEKQYL
uniref:Uncharacterized protein n=1 Tax=Oryza brachyantha TaxID=4533 RepID=J3MS28_ORYBR